MNYHICIVSDHLNEDGTRISGEHIYHSLMSKKVWGLHPRTANRANVKSGDMLVFYLGGQHVFLGTAKAVSGAYLQKEDDAQQLFLNSGTYRVDIDEVSVWERPKPIKPLLKKLSFIKNEEHWGPYLQGGVRKISESDFKTILESEDYDAGSIIEKTTSEIVIAFNPESAVYRPHSLEAPERVKINRIIENLEKGWQIPNFQRYFDWNKEDVRSLLESVFNDYYVGSFLLWEATEDPNLAVEPIKGVENTEKRVDHIILDGQQRMTALYYAIKTPDFSLKGNGRKRSYYFLDLSAFLEDGSRDDVVIIKDKKISRSESYKELLFPFYELNDLRAWIDGFEDYLDVQMSGEANTAIQVKNIRRTVEKRLEHVWNGFEIPYVTLPASMDLTHVADVFEKINSKGKPLNTFDLLIARLLKYGIKLKDLWDKACDEYPNIKRYDEATEKTRMAVFQTMSLLHHPASSSKRKDILNIFETLSISDSSQFESYWKVCIEAIDKAIRRLENMRDGGLGVRSEKDLLFMPSLPMLAAFLARIEGTPNEPISYNKIQQWYWSASITGVYSQGADSQMSSDFKEVNNWFDNDDAVPTVVIRARNNLGGMSLIEIDEPSSALYRAVLSLVALAGAKDFATNQNLEDARDNQKDHIFPKSTTRGFGGHENIDSVINMTWMSGDTNMLIKRAKKPSEYIPLFIKEKFGDNENAFIELLSSHLIDGSAFGIMKEDKIDDFLLARQTTIKRNLRDKIGGGSEVESKIEDDPNSLIDEVEEKTRVLIDETLTKKNQDYWDTLIPQGVRERVAEKITQHNGRHPSEASTDRDGFDKLCFCDIMDYHEIITSRLNWVDFEGKFGKKSEVDKHFGNIKEYRNCIKHSRPMNNVVKKQGEASLEWIYSILKGDASF
jgi:predicted RNA-binding protein